MKKLDFHNRFFYKHFSGFEFLTKDFLYIPALTLVFFLLSFPNLEPVYYNGIDPYYSLAYNYLFSTNHYILKDMVFPYGPFTFLRSPLIIGNNYLIAFVFRILLRFLFIYSTIYLLRKNYQKYWLIRSLVFLVMLFFINFDTEYFGLVVSIIFLHKFSNRKIYLIFLVSFIVLGFFIKSALGIYTGMFVASYFIYLVLDKKKILFLICLVMLIPVLFSISWFLCFNSLDGMISLITGYFFFTAGNSSAVSLIPDNNWMQLIPAILILLLYPFYRKDKITWFIYLIFGLFLFASWKYGMARQDFLHQQQFFINFLLFWSLVIIFSEKRLLLPLFAGIISLFLLFLNINVTSGGTQFPTIHTVLNGFDNFNKHIIHYNLQQKKYLKDFNYNLEGNILPTELRETISKKTVDVYPWNYGVIASNKLNYKPRPLIQSYLSYSSWLDNRNNIYFSSGNTPEFILWELIQGRWSDSLTSIDGRYGMNDEPQTILSIIQHYDIIQKDKRFLLFKKSESAKQIKRKIIKSESLVWKKWVKVPKANQGILRAKIDIKRNFWGYLKNLFFKDEVFYVEMKLEDGSTRNYRIIKGNFGDGIWINPLIANPVNNFTEPEVKEIRILSSNYHLFKENILVDWELITFSEVNCLKWNNISSVNINPINLYFKKNDKPPDTCIIQSLNDYEKEYKYWNTPAKYYSDKYLSGHRSFELDTNSFSNGFKIHGNDIDYHSVITVNAGVRYLLIKKPIASVLTIEVSKAEKIIFWKSVNLNDYIVNTDDWNVADISEQFPKGFLKDCTMEIFVWNTGKNKLLLDDFQVSVYKR